MENAFEIDCGRLYNICVLIQKEMAPNFFPEDIFRLYLSALEMIIEKDATDYQKSLLREVNPLVLAIKESGSYSEPNVSDFLERQRGAEFEAWGLSEEGHHEQGIA